MQKIDKQNIEAKQDDDSKTPSLVLDMKQLKDAKDRVTMGTDGGTDGGGNGGGGDNNVGYF